LPQGISRWQAAYHDDNFSGRIGWQEVVVQAAGPITVVSSSVPATDQSQELRVYPTDMLQSPLATTSAEFSFEPGAGGNVGAAAVSSVAMGERAQDSFAAL